jgi:hypothetical protein
MRKTLTAVLALTIISGVPAAAGGAQKLAVLDFIAKGDSQPSEGVDVADNLRLMFHGAPDYEVERYSRMTNAVDAALAAGLNLTTVDDAVRLGKALGDGAVVIGEVDKTADVFRVALGRGGKGHPESGGDNRFRRGTGPLRCPLDARQKYVPGQILAPARPGPRYAG